MRNKLYFPCYCSCVLSQWDVIGRDNALSVLGLGTGPLEYVFSYLKEFLDENFGLHIVLQVLHLSFSLLVFGLFLYYKCTVPNLESTHLIFNFVFVCVCVRACVCVDISYHCSEIPYLHCFQSPQYLHLLHRHLPRNPYLICIICVKIFGAELQFDICMLSTEPTFSFGKSSHKLPRVFDSSTC